MPDWSRVRIWTIRGALIALIPFCWYACNGPSNFTPEDLGKKLERGMTPNEIEAALDLPLNSLNLVSASNSGYGAELQGHDWRNTCKSHDEYILRFDNKKRLVEGFWMGFHGDHHDEQTIHF